MNASAIPPCGIYRHYKGGRYEVVGCARHESTGETLVIYRPLEPTDALPAGVEFWTRPLDIFNQTIEIDGVHRPRFAREV